MISANHLDPAARVVDLTETQLRYRARNTATFPIRRLVQLPRVRRFIAVSEVAAASHRRHGIDPVVIRNFAPRPPDAVPGWGDRAGALYLGRLTEAKGVRDVVELARAAPDVPVDIVGFGELGEALAAAAAELPNLTYHGWVPREETVRRLLGARVVLMPSLAPEGGPLVALQAMALGTPVVAYDAGGLGEYVRGGGGDVVERGAGALAGAVRRILTDEDAWAERSEHGRRAVYAEHTPSAYVQRLERIYAAVA
jgi:glycosyltransferase involved in cell wall biosynthesis